MKLGKILSVVLCACMLWSCDIVIRRPNNEIIEVEGSDASEMQLTFSVAELEVDSCVTIDDVKLLLEKIMILYEKNDKIIVPAYGENVERIITKVNEQSLASMTRIEASKERLKLLNDYENNVIDILKFILYKKSRENYLVNLAEIYEAANATPSYMPYNTYVYFLNCTNEEELQNARNNYIKLCSGENIQTETNVDILIIAPNAMHYSGMSSKGDRLKATVFPTEEIDELRKNLSFAYEAALAAEKGEVE